MSAPVDERQPDHGVFDVTAIAGGLPSIAGQPVSIALVTATADGSVRVLRVNQPTPAHYHAMADEHVYILSGSATFFVAGTAPHTLRPGQLFVARRGTVHGISAIHEQPLTLLIIDTPRRPADDMIFVAEPPA